MTDSQFETLRQELRALRSDLDQRFDSVNQRFDNVETRLTKLEVQLDGKPDKAFVFQTVFTVNASFLAVVGMALLIVRSFLMPV
jgi:hypothetical protein